MGPRSAAAFALAACLAAWSAWSAGAAADGPKPVALELVLAVDASLSVDDREFALQMQGIASAFRTPDIVALIGEGDGVAVTLIQWSDEVDPRFTIPWHHLTEPASVHAFAERVERAARAPDRSFTAMGRAIDVAIGMIVGNDLAGRELKIDVSADGLNNIGPPPTEVRGRAQALNIAINGLPILTDHRDLDAYFREQVVAGPGAFVEIADDYEDFARVFLRKLRRELSPYVSDKGAEGTEGTKGTMAAGRDPPRRAARID
jgi:hypothetical protein